jgi:DNA topoisomerase-3
MKRLFVAEKSSFAKDLSEFMSKKTGQPIVKHEGFWTVGDDHFVPLRGHLFELIDPKGYNEKYEKWTLEDLPIIPDPFRVRMCEGMGGYVKALKTCLSRVDHVINACDAGQEGELIFRLALQNVSSRNVPFQRLWVTATNTIELEKAFAAIKPGSQYDGYYYAALARSHADWIYGINLSRAYGIAARQKGASGTMSVGRVQTPALNLVVVREREIALFTPVNYFVPKISMGTAPPFKASWKAAEGDPRVDEKGRILDRAAAERIANAARAAGKAVVQDVLVQPISEPAALPFSLASLQLYCGRVYGYGVEQTLEIAQSLYDKKLISYPRSGAEYLLESQHPEAGSILTALAAVALPPVFGPAIRGADLKFKSRAFNDKKIIDAGEDHHALIPIVVENPEQVGALTKEERNVFFEIVRRYILQFWPEAEYDQTQVTLAVGQDNFTASGRRYTENGWKTAFPKTLDKESDESDDDPAQSLPVLNKGAAYPVLDATVSDITTQPPKRYKEHTLLAELAKISGHVKDPVLRERLKDVGIGTPATRAAIISKLLATKLGYLEKNGAKELVPTDKAITLIQELPKEMTAPDMTASWQLFMDSIKTGKATYEAFMSRQKDWVTKMIQIAGEFFEGVEFKRTGDKAVRDDNVTHPCLKCGGKIVLRTSNHGPFYICQNEECKAIMGQEDGKPVLKTARAPATTGPTCPTCNTGTLRRIERRDKAGHFWACSQGKEKCAGIFSDKNNAPDFEPRKGRATA